VPQAPTALVLRSGPRERLLKLSARVVVSVRRMVLYLPAWFPFLPAFRKVALAPGAAPR
jgi:hypothetical protein